MALGDSLLYLKTVIWYGERIKKKLAPHYICTKNTVFIAFFGANYKNVIENEMTDALTSADNNTAFSLTLKNPQL